MGVFYTGWAWPAVNVWSGVGVVCSEWAWLTENGQGNAMGVVYSGGRGLERRGGAEPQFRATHTRCGAGCGTGEMQPPPRKVRAGWGAVRVASGSAFGDCSGNGGGGGDGDGDGNRDGDGDGDEDEGEDEDEDADPRARAECSACRGS